MLAMRRTMPGVKEIPFRYTCPSRAWSTNISNSLSIYCSLLVLYAARSLAENRKAAMAFTIGDRMSEKIPERYFCRSIIWSVYVWSSLSIVILTLIWVLYLFKGVVNLPTQRCSIYIKCYNIHHINRSLQEHTFRGQIIRAAPNRSPTVESGCRRNHYGYGPRTQSEIAEATISHCRRARRCQNLPLDKGITST